MPDITIGRLRGGFAVSWWEDGKRRRYQLTARTRAEAEAEARDRYLKETTSPDGITVEAIWSGYIDHLGSKPTATTMSYTGKAILPTFGALRPDQITVDDCRGYVADRLKAGKAQGSAHTELGHLRSAMKWARKAGLIDRAPHIELPSKPASRVAPLSDDQMRRLIDGAEAPHIRLAIILLFCTGARVGALLDLTWDRVDFDRGVIDLRLPDGATRKGRAVVPMNRMARAALTSSYEAALTDYVIEYAGRRVKSIRKGYRAAVDRAGIDDAHIHQIRHSVAVRMLQSRQPIEVVAQFLGHSNTQITYSTYARFMPEHLADAADILDLDIAEKKRNGTLLEKG